jgi:hypothetical protein
MSYREWYREEKFRRNEKSKEEATRIEQQQALLAQLK